MKTTDTTATSAERACARVTNADAGASKAKTLRLIGTDGLHTPSSAKVGEEISGSRPSRVLGAAPAALATLARLAWRTSRLLSLLAAVVALASGLATSFGLLATTTVFTQLLAQGPTPQRLVAALPALALAAAAFAARGLLDSSVGAVHAMLAPRVEQHAQDELHAAVIDTQLVAFDDAEFTELVRRGSVEGVRALRAGITDAGTLLSSLVSLTAAIITAGVLQPVLVPVVLLAAAPHGWACLRAARLDYQWFARTVAHFQRRAVTSDLITGRDPAAEIRAYTAGPTLLAEHQRISAELTAEAIRVERAKTIIRLAGRALAGIGAVMAYGVLAALIYSSILPLALAGAAAIAMRTATSALTTTVLGASRLFEYSFYLDMLTDCIAQARHYHHSAPQNRRSATSDHRAPGRLPHDPKLIEVRNVSFTYPGGNEPAIADVSLSIARGQVIALVGENGSGKTTLAKIIAGLYRPDTGHVTWDGVDSSDVHPHELHSHIALIPQNPTQWPMTAENNIRIGRLERHDPHQHALTAAAAATGADTIIPTLPHGWNTLLSRRFHNGADLSGGQWQRLSVARGIYRNASLLIADEPTATLDARAEHAIFKTLHSASGAHNGTTQPTIRTAILITHRLANIRHADHIIVLDRGRIIEQGTHQQLITHNGAYAGLFDLQAKSYREPDFQQGPIAGRPSGRARAAGAG